MHLISSTIEGVPAFYSIKAGRALGSLHGWTQDREQALQFAREQDAKLFADSFLPNIAPFASIVEVRA